MLCQKIKYNLAEVQNELKKAKKGTKRRREKRYYKCERCGGEVYHLTSKEDWIKEVENIKCRFVKRWKKLIKKSRKLSYLE